MCASDKTALSKFPGACTTKATVFNLCLHLEFIGQPVPFGEGREKVRIKFCQYHEHITTYSFFSLLKKVKEGFINALLLICGKIEGYVRGVSLAEIVSTLDRPASRLSTDLRFTKQKLLIYGLICASQPILDSVLNEPIGLERLFGFFPRGGKLA